MGIRVFTGIAVGMSVLVGAGLVAVSATQGQVKPAPGAAGKDVKREVVVVQPGPAGGTSHWASQGSRIGVAISDVAAGDARSGAIVDEVTAGSPAEKAGFRAGDLIVAFDGERVRSARQLTRIVDETPAGRAVKASVVREGRQTDLSVTPEADSGFALRWLERGREHDARMRVMPREFHFEMPEVPDIPDMPELQDRIVESMVMRPPRLGVSTQGLTPELAEYFGVKEGVLVSSVSKESAAAKAGVKAGDVITSVDGRTVEDSGDLRRELWKNEEATEVTLGVVRDRKPLSLKVQLASPEAPKAPRRRSFTL